MVDIHPQKTVSTGNVKEDHPVVIAVPVSLFVPIRTEIVIKIVFRGYIRETFFGLFFSVSDCVLVKT